MKYMFTKPAGYEAAMNRSFVKIKIPTFFMAVTALLLFMGFPFVNVLTTEEVYSQFLSLSLSLDSDSFLESEEIWVHVAVVNRSGIPQQVQPFILSPESQGVRFVLREHNGAVVHPSGDMVSDDYGLSKYITIPPFDSLSDVFNITAMFSTSGNIKAPPYLVSLHYLKSGDYSLQTQTFTGKDTIRSNTVRFVVVKATGEEAKALEALRDADGTYLRFETEDNPATVLSYERFLKNFPNSTYVPYAYKQLIFLHRNKERALDLVAELAEKFPNNGRAVNQMKAYSYIFIKEGKRDILERIARSHPNSEVSKLIQRRLMENQR